MTQRPFHIEFLQTELAMRKERNARYSLRAFSRSLRIDPAALSRILSGKQELSPKACPQILRAMKAAPADCEMFIASVLAEKESTEFNSIVTKLQVTNIALPARKLPRAVYDRLANRYHSAVLGLFLREDFRTDTAWMAKEVDTTEIHVEWILSVLVRAGLILQDGDRLYRAPLEPSQILTLPTGQLEPDRLPASRRIRIDSRRLSEAQTRLEKFLADLEADYGVEESGHACTISAQLLLRT